jgi:ketosteroid isomerase-like protein
MSRTGTAAAVPGGASVQTLEAFLDAFNRHDLDAIMGFFGEDCSFDFPRGPHPWGNRAVGKTQVRALLATRFAGLPDVAYRDAEHWTDGRHGVSRWRLMGTRPTGEKVEVHGCDLLDFAGGKIVRKDSYWKIVE